MDKAQDPYHLGQISQLSSSTRELDLCHFSFLHQPELQQEIYLFTLSQLLTREQDATCSEKKHYPQQQQSKRESGALGFALSFYLSYLLRSSSNSESNSKSHIHPHDRAGAPYSGQTTSG